MEPENAGVGTGSTVRADCAFACALQERIAAVSMYLDRRIVFPLLERAVLGLALRCRPMHIGRIKHALW
jgi:hypothetical protein